MENKLCFQFYFIIFILMIPDIVVPRDLDVYVIGGTGDLAKRYLWPGFFELYRNNPENNFTFYGASKTGFINIIGEVLTPFQELIKQSVICTSNDQQCNTQKDKFISQMQYIQLRNMQQYKELCTSIIQSSQDVIFYLSVPPSAYEKIVQMISSHCDLRSGKRSYKFVFEKPFGTNLESAQRLSSLLHEYLDEGQIYRVDHYLGKETVGKILHFRRNNLELDVKMNRKYVKRIDIVVTETLGCEDRTSYYDKSGIIRDMLQSHLTEVLCHMTMDLHEPDAKLQFLQNTQTVQMRNTELAQYKGYKNETAMETSNINSNTPTFAAVEMKITSKRWKDVPMRLISGKKLNERAGYGRIIFKRKYFSNYRAECLSAPSQVIYVIRHEKLKSPAILISRVLPYNHNYVPDGWRETTKYNDTRIFGSKGECFRVFIPKFATEAYTHLIAKLYEGNHKYFVPGDQLIESWRIWSPIVTKVDSIPRVSVYEKGNTVLNILRITDRETQKCNVINLFLMCCHIQPSSFQFLGFPATVAPMPALTKALSNNLKLATWKRKNSQFHLALSGGNSPLELFKYLRRHKNNFPWSNTHIWQVDERCSKTHSNFVNLKSHLLDFLPEIDSSKVHPMPVFLNELTCSAEAANMYENMLIDHTSSKMSNKPPHIDFVLLGLGSDGHTASLFPGMSDMLNTSRYVVTGEIPDVLSQKRMTLTFKTLNSAKNIAILVSGQSKCEILRSIFSSKLCDREKDENMTAVNKYPICGILSSKNNVEWYIEEKAFECIF